MPNRSFLQATLQSTENHTNDTPEASQARDSSLYLKNLRTLQRRSWPESPALDNIPYTTSSSSSDEEREETSSVTSNPRLAQIYPADPAAPGEPSRTEPHSTTSLNEDEILDPFGEHEPTQENFASNTAQDDITNSEARDKNKALKLQWADFLQQQQQRNIDAMLRAYHVR